MKIHFKIPGGLKEHVHKELQQAESEMKQGHLKQSWRHLERAHILGQAWPVEHTLTHWKMFQFAIKVKNTREILGQIPRLLVGGVMSFVGEIPVGNTGGADVPPLKAMEIPEGILQIFNKYQS